MQESLQDDTNSFDPTVTHDDFLDQMLSGLQTTVSWPEISAGTGGGGQNKSPLPWVDVDHFDDHSAFLSSKLRQHQISADAAGGRGTPSSAVKSLQLSRGLGLASAAESALFGNDNIDDSSFKSPIGDNNSIQNLFHGFTGSLTSNQTQQFRNLPAQNFGSPVMNQLQTSSGTAAGGGGGGGAPSQPRQRVRARRGQATDPHSIAERVKHNHRFLFCSNLTSYLCFRLFMDFDKWQLRRERIAERMKALQELVPNANKTDKASMLDEIIDYVKFLQLQVKVLSMSRLGGAAAGAIAPIVTEGGGAGRSSNGTASSSNNDAMTVTENQVVKLMEEDMGSAMQYLQGKGLCLMPISLATAISSATCHPSASRSNLPSVGGGGEGGGPSSPNMSVLTVQSANGVSVKDSP